MEDGGPPPPSQKPGSACSRCWLRSHPHRGRIEDHTVECARFCCLFARVFYFKLRSLSLRAQNRRGDLHLAYTSREQKPPLGTSEAWRPPPLI